MSEESMHDRPTVSELIEAVREFLERDVMTASDARVAFHARVAANVLRVVERELVAGERQTVEEHRRLVALLGHDGALHELEGELASAIRDGSLDDRRTEVVEHVRGTVRAKLEVANPNHLESSS
ncbi:MAG TPA: DUF6285 domain-containing protein [Acidimicrobiia bacterium]|jgi:hypothetical protein